MPEHIQYEDDDLFNPETHHEPSDVPVRPLFWFIVIFIVFGVVSHLALWFMYKALVKAEQNRQDPRNTAVARPADANVPQNQPLLQPFPRGEVPPQRNTPVTDLEDMRAAEDKVLKNYGWVDRQRGIVHMPIEKAKDLALTQIQAQQTKVIVEPYQSTIVPVPAGTPASPPAGQAPSPAPATATTTGGQQ